MDSHSVNALWARAVQTEAVKDSILLRPTRQSGKHPKQVPMGQQLAVLLALLVPLLIRVHWMHLFAPTNVLKHARSASCHLSTLPS